MKPSACMSLALRSMTPPTVTTWGTAPVSGFGAQMGVVVTVLVKEGTVQHVLATRF